MENGILRITQRHITMLCACIFIIIGQIGIQYDQDVLIIVAMFLSFVCAVFIKSEELLFFMLYILASNRVLTYGPISAPAIVMIVGVGRDLLSNRKKINSNFLILAIMLMIYSVGTSVLGDSQILSSLKIIVVLLFMEMQFKSNDIKEKYLDVVSACSIGCIIAALMAIVVSPTSLVDSVRFSLTDGGGENVLGILCGILGTAQILLVLERRSAFKHSGYVVILSLIGLLTGSRSFLLGLGAGVLVILLTNISRANVKRLLLFVLAIGLIGIVLTILFLTKNEVLIKFFEQYIYRFNKLVNTDISNGRFELWRQYINVFIGNPIYLFFGSLNYKAHGIEMTAHNMILEQLVNYGIFGNIILWTMYGNVIKRIKRFSGTHINMTMDRNSILISLMVVSMFSHSLFGIPQTTILFISLVALLVPNENYLRRAH